MSIVERFIRKLRKYRGPTKTCRKCGGDGYIIVEHVGCPFDKCWLQCPACCGNGWVPEDQGGEKG